MTYIPHNIDINDYDYPLPSERIARYPLPERDASMLLFFDGKDIEKKRLRRPTRIVGLKRLSCL